VHSFCYSSEEERQQNEWSAAMAGQSAHGEEKMEWGKGGDWLTVWHRKNGCGGPGVRCLA
jgi:hypothetical protein